jgi:hypothetical protein
MNSLKKHTTTIKEYLELIHLPRWEWRPKTKWQQIATPTKPARTSRQAMVGGPALVKLRESGQFHSNNTLQRMPVTAYNQATSVTIPFVYKQANRGQPSAPTTKAPKPWPVPLKTQRWPCSTSRSHCTFFLVMRECIFLQRITKKTQIQSLTQVIKTYSYRISQIIKTLWIHKIWSHRTSRCKPCRTTTIPATIPPNCTGTCLNFNSSCIPIRQAGPTSK